MWQQLRQFTVRLNKNIQTNYFRTKNGDKMLKYNINLTRVCTLVNTVCRVLRISHDTPLSTKKHNMTAIQYCIQITRRDFFCHTPNRYHIQYTAVPKVLAHLCLCLCVCVCCHPVYSRRLSSPFGISWARQPGSHNSFFFPFLGGGTKQCPKYSSTAAVLAL